MTTRYVHAIPLPAHYDNAILGTHIVTRIVFMIVASD